MPIHSLELGGGRRSSLPSKWTTLYTHLAAVTKMCINWWVYAAHPSSWEKVAAAHPSPPTTFIHILAQRLRSLAP